VSFFQKKKHDEFVSEMPEYDDEEYYGEEEGEYAEDGEYDEDYDEEDEGAPAPKKNVVRTALMGVVGVAVLLAGVYYAGTIFAPETTQEIVNNLPFVSHEAAPAGNDQFTDVPQGEQTPPAADGQVAPPPEDVTASSDVAAVPPVPAKPKPVKPTKPMKAAPKPVKPIKVAQAPAPEPVAPKPAAKPAPKKKWVKPAPKTAWAPKSVWKPKSTWKPRAYTRYARYYAQPRYGAYRYARPGTRYAAYNRARYSAYSRARYAAYNRARYGRTYAARAAWGKRYRTRYAAPRTAVASNGGRYAVQVGSFSDTGNAQALAGQLRAQGMNAYVSGGATSSGAGQLVRSVGVRSNANARRLLAQYRAAGYPARIVSLGNGLKAVSAGVYSSPERAQQVVATLNQRGLYATSGATAGVTSGGGMARVYVGAYKSRTQAAAKMRQLQQQGIPAAVTAK
jgi:cell division septation protein DedD/outer membrane biosynthesis protein TonB